ncbi:hypothetical protein DM860_011446 [Cuscuta australis]|uniref:CCHC-type domain-containing protein n=1 Tax=Cuscuta australis TaxID=267555 RepID=A0A328DUS1_9ASTE|nr:hypothetical protein DM860_011446 [Cuscuta australis]
MGKRGRPPKTDGKAQNESIAGDIYTEKLEGNEAYQTNPNGEDDEGKNKGEETLMPESTTTKEPVMEKAKSYADAVGIQEDLKLDLKFIPAEIIEGNPVARLTMEDVIEPGIYWESALVCCVLGANPPLEVIKGFLHRIWKAIQVEVQINQKFPDQINFINEEGRVITQNVIYEWTPAICSNCNRIGHIMEKCRKKSETKGEHFNRRKMAWRPKVIPEKNDATHEEEPSSEEENKKTNHDSTPINKETKNTEELENNEGFTEVHKKKAARRVSLEGGQSDFIGMLHRDISLAPYEGHYPFLL